MKQIGIRELRNRTSELVRRVRGGERILITSNGIPVAELGPVTTSGETIEELAANGLIRLPQSDGSRPTPTPVPARPGVTSDQVLADVRSR
ncbi:MAG: type II toxin-antitoxin system prevent-host-death family antitoxin [Acidimicrobiia bacterium]|nr:type II toxin-antitoxin system prevent-host-death family antitoxin [Acidimicrobiia bacterium]